MKPTLHSHSRFSVEESENHVVLYAWFNGDESDGPPNASTFEPIVEGKLWARFNENKHLIGLTAHLALDDDPVAKDDSVVSFLRSKIGTEDLARFRSDYEQFTSTLQRLSTALAQG